MGTIFLFIFAIMAFLNGAWIWGLIFLFLAGVASDN